MRELLSERLKVRAALFSLQQQPHRSRTVLMTQLRDKMRVINEKMAALNAG